MLHHDKSFSQPPGGRREFLKAAAAIKPTDGVIVGIYDRYSDRVAENTALVRRFGV